MVKRLRIDNRQLQTICSVHGLGQINTIDWAGRGMNNPVLIINDRYVIRFDGLGLEGRSRFWGEKLAYENLRTHSIPAPEVIALDVSRTLAPQDYLIMTKIEGRPIIDSWPALTPAQREQVAYETGTYLAMMHDISFSGYGQLRHEEADRFSGWYEYVLDYMGRYGRQAVEAGILQARQCDHMLAIFERNKALLQQAAPGRLVHWDYHFENILQQDGHVTGILDFEWALSGDPMYDFKVRDQWEETCPGSRDWVYRGYTDRRPLPGNHEQRVMLYGIMMYLDYAVDTVNEQERAKGTDLLLRQLATSS